MNVCSPEGKIGHVYILQYYLDCLFYPIIPRETKISGFTATPILIFVSFVLSRHDAVHGV
jgi:hypothetical protein